jgi:hypothetical protein
MTAPVLTAPVSRRARLGRYALWQARDFTMNTAIITIILFGLFGAILVMNIHAQEEMAAAMVKRPSTRFSANMDVMKLSMFRDIYGMFTMVAPIIALSGIISQDRSSGFTRFLFAKPLSPRMFYLQSFLIRFAGYLAVGHLLLFWYGLYEPPAYTWHFLADMSISFVTVGGIVLLFSVLSKYDGLIAIAALLVASIFWDKWEHAEGFRKFLPYLLPPIGKVGDMHVWLFGLSAMNSPVTVPFPAKWALWLAGYGLACGVLGLYLLRRIPLTKA